VRIQLPATSAACARASNPPASRACCGTCAKNVDTQIASTNASPSHALQRGTKAGGAIASQTASASSALMSGSTSHVIRSECSASYAANSRAPTRAKSG
jgi:hypothetical protein